MPKNRPPLIEGHRLAILTALSLGAGCALAASAGVLSPLAAAALYLGLMSVFTFGLFAWDKRRAKRQARRISEANLMWAAWLGGAGGGWLALLRLRHKSRHTAFRFLLPLALGLQLSALGFLASSSVAT